MFDQNTMQKLYRLIGTCDWTDGAFDIKKAYICANFSELAYLSIPQHELEDASGVKVIPCADHQTLVREKRSLDLDEVFSRGDLGKQFVVLRRNVVIVGIVMPDVIFIAIRGTRPFYLSDWMVDLKCSPIRPSNYSPYSYHRGFYNEIKRCTPLIVEELDRLKAYDTPDKPIYITGHSLGGAMAGVLYSSFGFPFYDDYRSHRRLHPRAAYTFGMPRFGNNGVMLETPSPYHIFNKKDIVPHTPPKWMGYANPLHERSLTDNSMENIASRDTFDLLNVWLAKTLRQGIKDHSMEVYLKRLSMRLK